MSYDGYNLGNAYGRIIISDNVDEALRNAQRSFDSGLQGISRSMSRLGDSMQQIGAQLTLTLSPFSIFSAQAISTAIDFESAFAGVAKTVDATDEQLAALEDTIRRMATDRNNPLAGLNNADVTIAQIMELGGQLGVATDDLEQFAQTVGELTLATNLSAEEAALMIAQYANVSNMPIDDIDRFGAALVALGNNAATTEKDIMSMASRIAAAAESVGFSEQQVLQFSSVLSSAGISAELGGTNFSIILSDITSAVAKGGGELTNFARIAGMSASEFSSAWGEDAGSALQTFLAGLGEMTSQEQILAMEQLGFTGAEAQRVLRSLASNTEMLGDALQIATDGWRGFSEVNVDTYFQNFEARAKSLGFTATTTADDVAAMVSSIEDTATGFDFWSGQLYQYGAALANTGIEADVAGDAFAGIMENIASIVKDGGPQLEQFGQISGWTAEQITRGWDDTGSTLQDFLIGLSNLPVSEQIASLERLGFTGEQTQEVMLALAGDTQLLVDAWFLARDSTDEYNALTEEARRRLETTKSQVNALKNNFSELALTIGEQLLPIINDVLDRMLDFVGGITDWLKENPEVARTIGLITAALGALGPALFIVGRVISLFGGSLGSLISIVRMFGAVFMAAFSPIGAVVAAGIALGVALYAAWESNFLGIRDTVLPVIEAVGNALGDLVGWFGGLIEVFQAEGLSGAFDYFVEGIGNLISGIWEAIQGVDWLELGASILRGIGAGIVNIATWVYDNLIVPLGNAIITYITSGKLWDDLVALGSAFFDGIAFGLKSLADIVTWVYANVILPLAFGVRDYVTSGQLWDDLVRLGKGIFDAVAAGIESIGPIIEWIYNNLIEPMGDAIGEYIGSGKIWEDLLRLGDSILDALAAGLGNVAEWVDKHIIQPILNPLKTAQSAIDSITGMFIGGGGGDGQSINPAIELFPGLSDVGSGGGGGAGGMGWGLDVLNSSIPGMDSGGPGQAGSIYRVGRSQVGSEFFGVGDAGHFYPDFAENLARIAGAVMNQQMSGGIPEGRLSQGGNAGNEYNITIQIPPELLRNEPQLQEAGMVLGRSVLQEIRSRT